MARGRKAALLCAAMTLLGGTSAFQGGGSLPSLRKARGGWGHDRPHRPDPLRTPNGELICTFHNDSGGCRKGGCGGGLGRAGAGRLEGGKRGARRAGRPPTAPPLFLHTQANAAASRTTI